MTGETRLIEHGGASVILEEGPEGAALRVINADGRVLVPISVEQARTFAHGAPGQEDLLEIERRLLVAEVPPDLERHPHQRLRQGYLVLGAHESLRVRETGSGCKMTFKRGKGLTRHEAEVEVSELQASLLWPLVGDRVVDKTRYLVPDGDGCLEVDVYHGALEGLVVAEREFDDEAAARAWSPPAWAERDVTDDARYTAARLAVDGRPADAAP